MARAAQKLSPRMPRINRDKLPGLQIFSGNELLPSGVSGLKPTLNLKPKVPALKLRTGNLQQTLESVNPFRKLKLPGKPKINTSVWFSKRPKEEDKEEVVTENHSSNSSYDDVTVDEMKQLRSTLKHQYSKDDMEADLPSDFSGNDLELELGEEEDDTVLESCGILATTRARLTSQGEPIDEQPAPCSADNLYFDEEHFTDNVRIVREPSIPEFPAGKSSSFEEELEVDVFAGGNVEGTVAENTLVFNNSAKTASDGTSDQNLISLDVDPIIPVESRDSSATTTTTSLQEEGSNTKEAIRIPPQQDELVDPVLSFSGQPAVAPSVDYHGTEPSVPILEPCSAEPVVVPSACNPGTDPSLPIAVAQETVPIFEEPIGIDVDPIPVPMALIRTEEALDDIPTPLVGVAHLASDPVVGGMDAGNSDHDNCSHTKLTDDTVADLVTNSASISMANHGNSCQGDEEPSNLEEEGERFDEEAAEEAKEMEEAMKVNKLIHPNMKMSFSDGSISYHTDLDTVSINAGVGKDALSTFSKLRGRMPRLELGFPSSRRQEAASILQNKIRSQLRFRECKSRIIQL